MQQTHSISSSGLRNRVQFGTADQLADDIRSAATECHSALAKLSLRGEIDPGLFVRLAHEINTMLTAVTRIRGFLSPIGARIKRLSAQPDVKRYFRIVQLLINNNRTDISSGQREALDRERRSLIKSASRLLRQLRADVRTMLVMRLEMICYYRWFLKKAIEIYTTFKGVVREGLRNMYHEIRDPLLREVVTAALSSEEEFPTQLFQTARQTLPSNLSELEHQVVKQLDELAMIESRLREVKDSAAELETGEAVIRDEIRRSISGRETAEIPIKQETVLKGLDQLENAEVPSRIFAVKRNKE